MELASSASRGGMIRGQPGRHVFPASLGTGFAAAETSVGTCVDPGGPRRICAALSGQRLLGLWWHFQRLWWICLLVPSLPARSSSLTPTQRGCAVPYVREGSWCPAQSMEACQALERTSKRESKAVERFQALQAGRFTGASVISPYVLS